MHSIWILQRVLHFKMQRKAYGISANAGEVLHCMVIIFTSAKRFSQLDRRDASLLQKLLPVLPSFVLASDSQLYNELVCQGFRSLLLVCKPAASRHAGPRKECNRSSV